MITKRFHLLAVTILSLGLLSACGAVPSGSPDSGAASADQTALDENGRPIGRNDGSSSYLDGRNNANDPSRAGDSAGMNTEQRIHFGLNSAMISPEAADTLTRNARLIGQRALTVEGHCDERGTREYNLALGQKRADAVKHFLVTQGLNSANIKTVSYGKERPLVQGNMDAAWNQNRRAELVY